MQANIKDSNIQISDLIQKAINGEEVIFEDSGTPLAKLIPIPQSNHHNNTRKLGNVSGIVIADDFDEFDDELASMFGMKDK